MCGRVACTLAPDCILQRTGAKSWNNPNRPNPKATKETPNSEYTWPSYNRGPCTFLPCLVSKRGERGVEQFRTANEVKKEKKEEKKEENDVIVQVMRWGLVPSYSSESRLGNPLTINAREDRLTESPLWRRLFPRQRCAIIIQGYYEWQALRGDKQPHFFRFLGQEPVIVAGLWDCWKLKRENKEEPYETLYTCSVVTRNADPSCQGIHERMPVILRTAQDISTWIHPNGNLSEIRSIIYNFENKGDQAMSIYPVAHLVNNMKNNSPDLILPLSEYRKKKGLDGFFKKSPAVKREDESSSGPVLSKESPKETKGSETSKVKSEPQQPKLGRQEVKSEHLAPKPEPVKTLSHGEEEEENVSYWACHHCTFINSSFVVECEMCEKRRLPTSSSAPVSAKRKAGQEISQFFVPTKKGKLDLEK